MPGERSGRFGRCCLPSAGHGPALPMQHASGEKIEALPHRYRNIAKIDMPRRALVEIVHTIASRFDRIGERL